jgi:hypothetical protein
MLIDFSPWKSAFKRNTVAVSAPIAASFMCLGLIYHREGVFGSLLARADDLEVLPGQKAEFVGIAIRRPKNPLPPKIAIVTTPSPVEGLIIPLGVERFVRFLVF